MSSSNSEFHVPGGYHFDSPPSAPFLGADIFLPPKPPSSTSDSVLNLTKSTFADISNLNDTDNAAAAANTKRKRASQDSRESTPVAEWAYASVETSGDRLHLSEVNDRVEEFAHGDDRNRVIHYTLAGQIETPGATVTNSMVESMYSDIDYRRALGPRMTFEAAEAGGAVPAHHDSHAAASDQWTVFHALGSVVGKVWEFCKTGAFRGFYAGGGVGYDWETGKQSNGRTDDERPDPAAQIDSSIPGSFPQLEAVPGAKDPGPRHAGKRRQVSGPSEELGRNWVMVEAGHGRRSSEASAFKNTRAGRNGAAERVGSPRPRVSDGPSRRISTPVSRLGGSAKRGNKLRVSHTGSPKLSQREPASFASPRSPVSAGPTPGSGSCRSPTTSRIPMPSANGAVNPFARAASPAPGSKTRARHGTISMSPSAAMASADSRRCSHRRSHSSLAGGSPSRKSHGYGAVAEAMDSSPRLSDEAKKLAARRRAAEKDADAKMEAFNTRLQEMIRQGKEALGTRFEVDGDGDQDGFWMDDN